METFIKVLMFITMYSISCQASVDYTIAVDRAKTALYIQSGLSSKVDMISRYAEKRATYYCTKAGIEKPVDVAFFMYYTYKQQKLTIPLVYRSKLNVQPNQIDVEIPIPFPNY